MSKPRRHVVLNRADDKVGLSAGDVAATIGLPIDAAIPTSHSVQISVNQGTPVVTSDPRSPAGRAFAGLARRFADDASVVPERRRRFSRKEAK
jgi:pilus assembly protein CpaE